MGMEPPIIARAHRQHRSRISGWPPRESLGGGEPLKTLLIGCDMGLILPHLLGIIETCQGNLSTN